MPKSNMSVLFEEVKGKTYPRWRFALNGVRQGNGYAILQQARGLIARRLAAMFLRKLYCSDFFRGMLLDVIDVGAAGGLHRRWSPYEIFVKAHLFEPEKDAYEALVSQTRGNPHLQIYPHALSSDEAPLTVYVTAWRRATGSFPADPAFVALTTLANHFKIVSEFSVNPKALDSVVGQADFIKIDVEGLELGILKGSERLLKHALGLELEVCFTNKVIPKKPLFADVDQFCRERGFTLVDMLDTGFLHYVLNDQRDEVGGTLYATNAVYLRTPTDVVELVQKGDLPLDAIWRSALIYAVYGNLEYLRILTEFAERVVSDVEGKGRLGALKQAVDSYSGKRSILSRKSRSAIISFLGGYDRVWPF